MKKRFKILLIVSLCLNIILIGFIAGEVRHFRPHREASQFIADFMEKHEEQQHQINQERKRAINMLDADNFDANAYAEQIKKVSALQSAMFQDFAVEMSKKIRSLPKEERIAVMERLKAHHANPRRHLAANRPAPAAPAPAAPAPATPTPAK